MRIFEQLGSWSDVTKPFQRAPVEHWQPNLCGEMDLRIDRNGVWWHEGQPIRRPGLVRVLASVLTYEAGQWWLKSPVEQLAIEVDDAPFIITDYTITQAGFELTSNIGERIQLDVPWPLTQDPDGEWRPWIPLHGHIGARLSRSVLLDLVNQALEQNPEPSTDRLYWSVQGLQLPLGELQH